MDDLIKTVSEKAGINAGTGQKRRECRHGVRQEKAPMIGDQLKNLVSGGGSAGDMLGDLRKKIGI